MQENFYQYNLTRELASKYSHATYLASPTNEPDRQVVLTVFASSLFRFPHEREDLLQKVQRIKDCQHPHLVPILDMGIEEGLPFVVREYLPNGSLRSYLKEISPDRLQLKDALSMVLQVGLALVYVHEQNIVHGNINPENILLDGNGQAVLTNFSLVERKDVILRDQTSEEYAFCYMPPEQFAGSCDARSDQYALGCLAYELISGGVPFAAQTLASMIGHSSYTVPAPLSQSVADLPASLEVAVLKTLAKDPDDRFFDFSLFLEVIQSVLLPAPAFPLLRSTYAHKKRTISRPTPSTKAEIISPLIRKDATPELSEVFATSSDAETNIAESADAYLIFDSGVSEQTGTVSAEEEIDDILFTDPFQKQETGTALVVAPVSVVPRPRIGQTWQGRRRLLGLVLLLSMIFALLTYAFWPSGLLIPNTISPITNSTTPHPAANPGLVLVFSHMDNPTATPTAIPTVSPTAVSRFSPTATSTPKPTATAVPANPNPYSPYTGTLALNDPLSDNSRGYGWEDFPPNSGGASCQFIGGAYHSIESQSSYHACHAALQVSNFTLEVHMQIISGNCGGLVLRDIMSQAHAYSFNICQNGSYSLARLDGLSAGWATLTSSSSGAITSGLNQSNVIAAVVNGSTFNLYVNHQQITSVTDSTYTQGYIGLAADGNTEAAYTNARMWTL